MNLYQDFINNSKSASPAQEELITKGRNTAKVDPYLIAMVNSDRFSDEDVYRAMTQGIDTSNNRTVAYPNQVTNNFYQDRYDDYYTSRGEPIPPQSRGEHLWSRREDTGEILKVPPINNEGGHPSFHLTARADDKAGYKFYTRNDPSIGRSPLNGRLYSFNAKEWATKNPKNWNMVPQSTVDEWKWQPYNVPEIMSYIQQWEVYHTNTGSIKHPKNGYNSSEDLFYVYPGPGTDEIDIGIGHKVSGDREADTRRLLKQIAPHITYEELMAKRQGLTEAEVREFFFYNTREHITEAEKMFPLIYAEPDYLKQVLVSGRYQGFFKEKHNTVKYLQEAQAAFHIQDYATALEFYQKAADASLNRNDYREQKIKDAARDEPISGGLVDRYDDIKNSILKRVEEVKKLYQTQQKEND
ncbi:hypothetical protein CL634_01135 [bacterium]|nr:hypothetical protein [bacterium]|tara:strand:- start:5 stop:1240 length:1236 start_codon:yes stop_codon:yes gene_type:complete